MREFLSDSGEKHITQQQNVYVNSNIRAARECQKAPKDFFQIPAKHYSKIFHLLAAAFLLYVNEMAGVGVEQRARKRVRNV